MKKLIKYTSIGFGAFILIVIALGIAIKIYVTQDRVIQLIEENINARVEIKDISAPLWASLSGITMEGLKVGYRDKQIKKTPSERKPMGKPVIGFESFNFKVAVLKLITSGGKNFQLKTLLFNKPEAHIILYSKGGTNLDTLLASPPDKKNSKESKKNKSKAKKKKKTSKKKTPVHGSVNDSKPFSIKSVDTVIEVGRVGIENGNFTVNIQKIKNTLKLQNVNAYVDNILIDPNDLKNKNRVDLTFSFKALLDENKARTRKSKNQAVRSFVINFEANGRVKPFNIKTGYVTQQATIEAGLLSGTKFTGLAILKKTKDKAKLLKKAGVNLNFLKDEVHLKKDALMTLFYNSGKVTLKSSPRLDTDDFFIRLS